ncbi:hypothetical protein Q5752_004607 [Cryptotrichosporon argae]
MDQGLPYDAPSPSAAAPAEPATDADGDHPMLDRALDDYVTPQADVPEHVQGLLGRMGRGKVYLVEESVGIVHHDGDRRIRGDPRLAALAQDLETQDPTAWLTAISESSAGGAIRTNALFVSSELIKHLSTDKVISWATGLGAGVMGLEWLNDTSLVLIFPSAAAALLGLSLIAKAGFDPAEGDDPLLERAAHSVPVSLLPLAEPERLREGEELLPAAPAGDGPVRRKGRGQFGSSLAADDVGRFDLAPLAADRDFGLAPGVDPNERITVRYATAADGDRRKQAKESEWYRRHGRAAGKEVAPRRQRDEGRDGLSLGDRMATNGEGREFARRLGRERREPRPERERRRGRDELDEELDRMASRRAGGENGEDRYQERPDGRGGRGRERGERSGRREPRGKDDLDKELDDLFAARTTG